jgi:DNA-binding NarL/FixJ family response regulator
MNEAAIRVLIADDQTLVREGLVTLLGLIPGIEVAGVARDGEEAVELAGELRPDVVLMDLRMPRMDGIEATRRIVAAGVPTRIVVLTTFDLDEYVYAAVRAGASGFLLKDIPPADLVHAVRVAARGDALLAPALTRRLLDRYVERPLPSARPSELASLTDRELDVLRLLAAGRSNAEIAAELFLSEATVKTYVSRMLTKLDLRDRLQLAVVAYRCGLVTP